MKERSARSGGIFLENREVVALVVGSLVVLGVVFYLGVSVGKGLAPEPSPVAERSLEALDRQAEESLAVELTFAEKLTEEPEPEAKPEPAPEREAAQEADPEPEPEARPEAKPEPAPAAKAEAKPAAKAKPRQEPTAGAPRFAVQLASFPSRAEADAFAERLRGAGLSPRIVTAEIPEKGTYYRVRIGAFASREEADRYLDDLKREGRFDGIVMPVDG